MKKKVFISVLSLVLFFSLGIGIFVSARNTAPKKISYFHENSSINMNSPQERVGSADYVFVCKVTQVYDFYQTKDKRVFPRSIIEYDSEMTECVVQVLKNIKGELTENTPISYYKTGGVSEDKKTLWLADESDFIPETDKLYIFLGNGYDSEGTLTGGGIGSSVALEDGITEGNIESSEIYKKYVKAYEEQIIPNSLPGTYMASADKNFPGKEKNKITVKANQNENNSSFSVPSKDEIIANLTSDDEAIKNNVPANRGNG